MTPQVRPTKRRIRTLALSAEVGTLAANGTVMFTNAASGVLSGHCSDAAGNGTANRTQLQLWDRHSGFNRIWTRRS